MALRCKQQDGCQLLELKFEGNFSRRAYMKSADNIFPVTIAFPAAKMRFEVGLCCYMSFNALAKVFFCCIKYCFNDALFCLSNVFCENMPNRKDNHSNQDDDELEPVRKM